MKILSKLLSLLTILVVAAAVILVLPFGAYYIVTKMGLSIPNYYKIEGVVKTYLSPSQIRPFEFIDEQTAYRDRWKEFHFQDVLIPLPTRNPLFTVVPIVKNKKDGTIEFGLKLYNSLKREVARVYFLENSVFNYSLGTQKVYQIPIVEKTLQEIPLDKIWNDLFVKDIAVNPKSYGEVIYGVYLLEQRKKLFPKNLKGFGTIQKPNVGVVELEPPNKDFTMELVMNNEGGIIYSYLLTVRKDDIEAEKIRNYFYERIRFQRGSQDVANIVYKEFKSLDLSAQAEQEGMLYLLSAWTHWLDNQEFVRQMVELSERNGTNKQLLPVLYKFGLDRYGTTFTLGLSDVKAEDPDVELQRQIEIERMKQEIAAFEAEKVREKTEEEKKTQVKEDLDYELRKAKELRKKAGKSKIKFQ